jgi:hypothetical protein
MVWMAGEVLEEEWTAEEVELVMGAAGDMYVSDGSAGGAWSCCGSIGWIQSRPLIYFMRDERQEENDDDGRWWWWCRAWSFGE